MKEWKLGHWDKGHYVTSGTRGYWSKYGGGEKWREFEEEGWYCQSCNRKQFAVLPSYRIPLDSREEARVCVFCKHLSLVNSMIVFADLVSLIRPSGFTNAIANLLSLPLPY